MPLGEFIATYGVTILALIGAFVGLGRYENIITSLKNTNKDLWTEIDKIKTRNETKDKEADGFRETVLVTLAEIKKTLEFIQKNIQR